MNTETSPPQEEQVISFAEFKQKMLKPDETGKAPDFITPRHIEDLSEEEQDQLVHYLRVDRVAASTLAAHTRKDVGSGRVSSQTIANRITKKCDMISKKIEQMEKQQEMLDRYFQELRGLRLQAGMDPDG